MSDDKRRTGDGNVLHRINDSPLATLGWKFVTGVCGPLIVAGIVALVAETRDVAVRLSELRGDVSLILVKNTEQDLRLTRLEAPYFILKKDTP